MLSQIARAGALVAWSASAIGLDKLGFFAACRGSIGGGRDDWLRRDHASATMTACDPVEHDSERTLVVDGVDV